MSPRTVNPAAHASRRDEFIDAGQHLIQTRGYEQFSVEEVLAEVGASKGAFYHYFDSKQALLHAIVDRMVQNGVAVVAAVVADTRLSAIDKLHAYFGAIASFKAEQKELLLAVIPIWYSDDNAIVREKLRRETVRLVTPHFATIIRQGIGEGAFTLTDPDQMARVVLSLVLDMGDEAGQLFFARQANEIGLDDVGRRFDAYSAALERILGLPAGATSFMDESTLHTWFDRTQ